MDQENRHLPVTRQHTMIAAIYTQEEVDAYYQLIKRVEENAWIAAIGKQAKPNSRFNPAETKIAISLSCDDPSLTFRLELCRNSEIESVSITLHVQQGSRTSQAICRYDIHDSMHVDSKTNIPPRTPHKHFYNQIDYQNTRRWDRTATIIDVLGTKGSYKQVFERLKKFVLDDLRIEFYDRDVKDKYRLFRA